MNDTLGVTGGIKATIDAGATGPGAARSTRDATVQVEYSATQVVPVAREFLARHGIFVDANGAPGIAYNMLRTQVLQRMTQRRWNTLAVTGPREHAGSSLVAANLAISLARELHHTVLLVDLNLRQPALQRYFGLEPVLGVEDVLNGDCELPEALINPAIERLVLLLAKGPAWNSPELLASPATANLVAELKHRYATRFVVFDLPPLLSSDDALAFLPHTDCALIVVEDGKTQRDDLERALTLVRDSGTGLLGTVLNKIAPDSAEAHVRR